MRRCALETPELTTTSALRRGLALGVGFGGSGVLKRILDFWGSVVCWRVNHEAMHAPRALLGPENGIYKTVKARIWPWLSGQSPGNLSSCSLFSRRRWGSYLCWRVNHDAVWFWGAIYTYTYRCTCIYVCMHTYSRI